MCILKWTVLFGIFVTASCEHFEFGDKPGQPCILMDIDAKFNLSYTENENVTEIAPEFSLDGAEVVNASSLCGDDKFDSVLTLRIFPSQEHVKFKIGSRDQSDDLFMSLTLSLYPQEHFPDLNNSLPFEMKDSKNLPVGVYSNDSYSCQSEQRMMFNQNAPFKMAVMIRHLQVQAFLVEDARYGPVMECPLDDRNITTVAPETTMTTKPHHETTMTSQPPSDTTLTTQPHSETTMTSPITTQPHSKTTMTTKPPIITTQPAKLHTFVLRNGKQVCMVLQGKLSFEIPYMQKSGKSATAAINVPVDAKIGGSCSFNNTNKEQEITLSFYNGWELGIIIVKGEQVSGDILMLDDNDDTNYSWKMISLTYVIDDNFPDASNAGQNTTVVQDTFGQFQANMAGSYKCVAKQQVTLQAIIKLDLSEFQYRAFGTSTTDDFSSNGVSECSADDDNDKNNDKTLAIVLGAGFGGLAVLIILAGLIFRFRRQSKQRGTYQEI